MPGAAPRSGGGASGASVPDTASGRCFIRGRFGASLGRGTGFALLVVLGLSMPWRQQIRDHASHGCPKPLETLGCKCTMSPEP